MTIRCRTWKFILHKNLWHLKFILKLSYKELDLVEYMIACLWNVSHKSFQRSQAPLNKSQKDGQCCLVAISDNCKWAVTPLVGYRNQYSVTAWLGQCGSSCHSSPWAFGTYRTWSTHHSINTDIPLEEQDVKEPELLRIRVINGSAQSLPNSMTL